MTLLDLYKKAKRISGYFNSADIPLKYNGNDFNIDFEFESKDCIVSHIEVKQDPALTWEDVAKIITIYEAGIDNGDYRRYNEAEWMKVYSQNILRRFNEIRNRK